MARNDKNWMYPLDEELFPERQDFREWEPCLSLWRDSALSERCDLTLYRKDSDYLVRRLRRRVKLPNREQFSRRMNEFNVVGAEAPVLSSDAVTLLEELMQINFTPFVTRHLGFYTDGWSSGIDFGLGYGHTCSISWCLHPPKEWEAFGLWYKSAFSILESCLLTSTEYRNPDI